MLLYLIRHCQSQNNAIWAATGSSDGRFADPLLTGIGHQQAATLGSYLAANRRPDPRPHRGGPLGDGFGITHLYCSLMQRAIQTGSYVAEALELPLHAWPEIHERGGLYLHNPETDELDSVAGPGRAFFAAEYPQLRLALEVSEKGWWSRPYEDSDDALGRAEVVLHELLQRHGGTNDHVAFVTHGGFTQSLLYTLFGFLPEGGRLAEERDVWLKMNNGSITRIDITDDLLRLNYLNYIDYMPGELLT